MIDIRNQLDAIRREVTEQQTDDGEAVSVLLRRAYDSPIEDVWDAVTDPDRIARWLYPVSGELKVGGTFQLEGNAGGNPGLRAPDPAQGDLWWAYQHRRAASVRRRRR